MDVRIDPTTWWEQKIEEIKKDGNCKSIYGIDMFSPKYSRDEMVEFCKKQLDKLAEDLDKS